MIRLENKKNYNPKQTLPLMIEFRKRVDKIGTVVKNFRVADRAIEFDLYANNNFEKQRSIEELSNEYGNLLLERDLSNEGPILDKAQTVLRSVDLFNEQRYWECHETMEQIWRREENPQEKAVQQGFILAASALVHAQKDEDAICLGMIPRALAKLNQWTSEKYYSLNVGTLRRALEEMQATRKITFPKI